VEYFSFDRFLTIDGNIRFAAADKATVLYQIGPTGPWAKLCTIVFSRRNGAIFAQFTHYKGGAGIVSTADVTIGPSLESRIDFMERGKVSTAVMKYSHPPDGRAHFSQDGKSKTQFWVNSVPLSGEGRLFEMHAHHLEPFERLTGKLDARRLYLPFQGPASSNAVTLSADWRRKAWLHEVARRENRRLDLVDLIPGQREGTHFRAALVSQPDSFPYRDHVLLVSVSPIQIPGTITTPSMVVMGGWDPAFKNPKPGDQTRFLTFQYPIADPEKTQARIGTVDLG
jgi:hypothetical protein